MFKTVGLGLDGLSRVRALDRRVDKKLQSARLHADGTAGTFDGGKTWSTVTLAPFGDNLTTFAVLDAASGKAHNMGAIEGANLPNLTVVAANSSSEFSLGADGTFAKRNVPNHISFRGIPSPGIKGFRLGGADWVKLADETTLVASVILQWSFLAKGDKRASIASFKSTDGGYNWTFAGHIARADKVDSNEGPNENSLALLRNGSILCVMRLDAGDAGRFHRYSHQEASYASTLTPPGGGSKERKYPQSTFSTPQ